MPRYFSHRFRASELEARDAITAIMAKLRALGLPHGRTGDVELALAEAVNNIIEHAYEGRGQGEVAIRFMLGPDHLMIRIFDSGVPLPSGQVPPPQPADLAGTRDSLPEGGFGWSLIHQLTNAIHYDREPDCNILSLCFSF